MRTKDSATCSKKRVNVKCNDHICLRREWSCGDGQCIQDRFGFSKTVRIFML